MAAMRTQAWTCSLLIDSALHPSHPSIQDTLSAPIITQTLTVYRSHVQQHPMAVPPLKSQSSQLKDTPLAAQIHSQCVHEHLHPDAPDKDQTLHWPTVQVR